VQRTDVDVFAPAWEIDPDYSQTLKEAFEQGVEIIPLQAKVTPTRIELLREMPFELE
ncbi:MAG: DNA/RNA nuclease SfsA, partial [Bacteroidales bacterium]|nr:DNA/RNA nuclease SfsA [Bacteroidales bacterium]